MDGGAGCLYSSPEAEAAEIKRLYSKVTGKKAFIKAEDKRFYTHCGVDFAAILRAFFQNASNKKNVSGASTITMQLAKIINLNYLNQENLYRQSSSRTIKNKIQESFCAFKLEARFSKKEILELYLNSIPFGNKNPLNNNGIMCLLLLSNTLLITL